MAARCRLSKVESKATLILCDLTAASCELKLVRRMPEYSSVSSMGCLYLQPSEFFKSRGLASASNIVQATVAARHLQRGSAMIEFAVIGPLLTLIGLSLLQYGLLFFHKQQLNKASFMAARAGSTGHAALDTMKTAYARALVPMYGGGTDAGSLEASYVKAVADVTAHAQIEILNPTTESFSDFNDPKLQSRIGNGKRVIPNSAQLYKAVNVIGPNSGQNIQDANMLKLRITTGYEPQVPLMGKMVNRYLQWMDDGSNAFNSAQIAQGRIPVVSQVTLQMQSDAIEDANSSSPGKGNGGTPTNSSTEGNPPASQNAPPQCGSTLCTEPPTVPNTSGGQYPPGSFCTIPLKALVSADTLFEFDQSTLQSAGIAKLDAFIASAKADGASFETLNVTGYTDPLGSDAHNLALSRARADAVAKYLASHGVTAAQVNVVGKGAADPVVLLSSCSGLTGTAQQQCLAPNRRVEIELIPNDKP